MHSFKWLNVFVLCKGLLAKVTDIWWLHVKKPFASHKTTRLHSEAASEKGFLWSAAMRFNLNDIISKQKPPENLPPVEIHISFFYFAIFKMGSRQLKCGKMGRWTYHICFRRTLNCFVTAPY